MLYTEELDIALQVLAAIGLYTFINYVLINFHSVGGYISEWCRFSCFRQKPFAECYGKWAVVTGSSDGIGKYYALNLARRGMNLFLLSRTDSKLAAVAREIKEKYEVEVKWLAVDFSVGGPVYDKIQAALDGLEIGMLVNNVGISHEHPMNFEKLSRRELEETITVNISSTVMMTQMVLPEMKRRGRGMVVNISSTSALFPFPYVAMYGASKCFINSLTLALRDELRGTGVHCQLVMPVIVATNMIAEWDSIWWLNLISTNVEKYCWHAVSTIGKTDIAGGHWWHEVQLGFLRMIPDWLFSKAFKVVASPHLKRLDPPSDASKFKQVVVM